MKFDLIFQSKYFILMGNASGLRSSPQMVVTKVISEVISTIHHVCGGTLSR
jgi:hypothetical protein